MVHSYLSCITAKVFSTIEKISKNRSFDLIFPFLAVLISLFFAFPSFDVAYSNEMKENWDAVIEQAENPFTPKEYPPASHQANLTFRLIPVLIGHFLKIDSITGFLWLQGAALIILFYVLYALTRKVIVDRVSSIIITLSFSFIYIGNTLCSDYRGFFSSEQPLYC